MLEVLHAPARARIAFAFPFTSQLAMSPLSAFRAVASRRSGHCSPLCPHPSRRRQASSCVGQCGNNYIAEVRGPCARPNVKTAAQAACSCGTPYVATGQAPARDRWRLRLGHGPRENMGAPRSIRSRDRSDLAVVRTIGNVLTGLSGETVAGLAGLKRCGGRARKSKSRCAAAAT
jgi:hypothetical protein